MLVDVQEAIHFLSDNSDFAVVIFSSRQKISGSCFEGFDLESDLKAADVKWNLLVGVVGTEAATEKNSLGVKECVKTWRLLITGDDGSYLPPK